MARETIEGPEKELRKWEKIEEGERRVREAEDKIRNPDGSLNSAAIYRRFNRRRTK